MSLIKFQCPTCGASLEDPGQGATMRCPYCSTSFVVPQELITARAAMPAPSLALDPSTPPSGNPASTLASGQGIFYQDDFSNPNSGWEVGKRSGGVTLAYENGSH